MLCYTLDSKKKYWCHNIKDLLMTCHAKWSLLTESADLLSLIIFPGALRKILWLSRVVQSFAVYM